VAPFRAVEERETPEVVVEERGIVKGMMTIKSLLCDEKRQKYGEPWQLYGLIHNFLFFGRTLFNG